MKHEDILAKAEQEKIKAKLEQALGRLAEMDATARKQKAQSLIDAIVALRAKRDEIQTRLREFNDANDAKALVIKAEIESRLANFEEELGKLATRVKSQTTSSK